MQERVMMRVGISAEFMGAKRNGTATYSRNLLRGLAALEGQHQFYPYLTTRAALPLLPDAGNVTPRMVYPYNAYARLTATLPLELLLRPVDVLHAQGWGPVWLPCPMVLTVHDIGWDGRGSRRSTRRRWRCGYRTWCAPARGARR
jgi:hypothetical protein